nr:immunoglobulin light chain junction region [Macaca mulatta]MOW31780.1 immunoglobulin light chain junction region [Macaca mulatta]MOW32086.1 immunoglobulin light chain junction region [Macaca mulatta]
DYYCSSYATGRTFLF